MSATDVIDYYNAEGESIRALEVQTGQFVGTVYSYGEVKFPEGEEPILWFEYTIHESKGDTNSEEFKNFIGDILVEIIDHYLETQEIVFKGGI